MIDIDRRRMLGLAAVLPFLRIDAALAAGTADGSAAAWDLTDLYPSWDAWDAARKAVLAALPRLAAYRGHLGDSSGEMAKAMADISDVTKDAVRVAVYSGLASDADVRVAANQERNSQASDMFAALGEATSWMAPEVLQLGSAKVEAAISAEPVLQKRFAFMLRDIVRGAAHTLDAKGEALLAAASAPLEGPGEIRSQLVASDMPRPTVKLSDGREVRLDDQGYTLTRDAPNRDDRKLVFKEFFDSYGAFSNSLGAAYASKIKGDVFRAKARGYPDTLSYRLDGPNIPESVYRSLVAEANAGLPQLHRYMELRRKIMGLPDIGYYDLYRPLVSLDRKFPVADMRGIALEALSPLGPDYLRLFADSTAKKWMDPLPRTGKTSGAYMNGSAYDVHPYLLLNLGDNYDGLTTYVHEWGHAMHTLLAKSANPFETADYATFTAEIASTANEVLLSHYMADHAKTKAEKLFYLGQQLENARGTFFRQTQFAEFELKAHELAEKGEGMSGKKFAEIYYDILRRYYGPNVILPENLGNEWAYPGHFFRSDFYYVFQYATSITAGTWFANSILGGQKGARERYLDVLRAGGSDYPVAILQKAGLDMTGPAPYRQFVANFKDTLDKVEALV